MTLRLATLALAFLLLGGCVETRFASTPGTAIDACDARWKGLWLDVDPASRHDEAAPGFLVDKDCRFLLLEEPERGGPLKPVHIPLNFVHDRGTDYVVVADDQLRGVASIKPVGHGLAKAFFVARYRIDGARLEIDLVDTARVARLIGDGRLSGSVDRDGNEVHALVRGDPQRVLEILRSEPIFAEGKPLVLARDPRDLPTYERERLGAKRSR